MTHNLSKKKPLIGVGVVVVQNGKVLLGERKGSHGTGDWSIPGGHLEFGESVAECAKRELIEETGLVPLSLKMGPWTEDVIDNEKHYISFFVFVNHVSGEPQLLEPQKCGGWEWFAWNALPFPLFRTVQSLITKVGIKQLASFADESLNLFN